MDRNKWAFWLFILAVFLVASIPSSLLLDALGRYRRSLAGFEPVPLRPVQVRLTPHREEPAALPNLEFVPFRLKAPKAASVQLVGDFNGWKPGALPLTRSGECWEVLVPLPPGRYRYLFLVDGESRPDPENEAAELTAQGQRASVRSVP